MSRVETSQSARRTVDIPNPRGRPVTSAKSIGRTVGLLSLLRLPCAPLINFVLFPPATGRDFLVTAAAGSAKVRLGLMLTFVLSALTIAVVLVVFPLFRRYSERLAHALLVLSAIGVVFVIAEDIAVAQMLSLSEAHAGAGAPSDQLQALGRAARATWMWSHFSNLLVGMVGALVFGWILFRHALVPRALAGLVVATSAFAAGALALRLLGYPFAMWTLTPMGLVQLALMVWLLARGFTERPLPSTAV